MRATRFEPQGRGVFHAPVDAQTVDHRAPRDPFVLRAARPREFPLTNRLRTPLVDNAEPTAMKPYLVRSGVLILVVALGSTTLVVAQRARRPVSPTVAQLPTEPTVAEEMAEGTNSSSAPTTLVPAEPPPFAPEGPFEDTAAPAEAAFTQSPAPEVSAAEVEPTAAPPTFDESTAVPTLARDEPIASAELAASSPQTDERWQSGVPAAEEGTPQPHVVFQVADAAAEPSAGFADDAAASLESPAQVPAEPEPFANAPSAAALDGAQPPAFDELPRSDTRQPAPLSFDEPSAEHPAHRNAEASATAMAPSRAAPTTEAVGRPGDQTLEGVQTPALSIEKTAPAEVQVGAPAEFRITVRNAGHVAAHHVEIHDQVPAGAELVGTQPQAEWGDDGQLVWQLGMLAPGAESVVRLQLVPREEGELGSVATVHFSSEASVRTRATRPELRLEVSAPPQAMIHDPVQLKIRVANVGSGAAQGVVIEEQLPTGLEHPAGSTLEYEIGALAPGETRELELTVNAAQAGRIENVLRARGQGSLAAECAHELEVIAPGLALRMSGPKRRYLERQATYTLNVSNPGTAPARNVELVTYLPKGFKFVEANNYGEYDPQTRAVRWLLEELPPQESGDVQLVAVPVETGEQKLVIQGQAQQGLKAEDEQTVVVEGLAAILFEVVDRADPIEIGAETTYEIRVVNQGTKPATNVRLLALLPDTLELLDAGGASRAAAEGNRVQFQPLARLEAKSETTFQIRARGRTAGDSPIRVQLLTDDLRAPVTKEESTKVYADE